MLGKYPSVPELAAFPAKSAAAAMALKQANDAFEHVEKDLGEVVEPPEGGPPPA